MEEYYEAIDQDFAEKERNMEVDSFLDEIHYSLQHPKSPRNYATGSTSTTTTTNFGRGEASLLVQTRLGTQIAARTTLAHSGSVAQGGETLAAANTRSLQTGATTGGGDSSMIIDDEGRSGEKESEDVLHDTSSEDTTMSSTSSVVNHQPPPPLPPPPPLQPPR
jgi:hypothetical protein